MAARMATCRIAARASTIGDTGKVHASQIQAVKVKVPFVSAESGYESQRIVASTRSGSQTEGPVPDPVPVYVAGVSVSTQRPIIRPERGRGDWPKNASPASLTTAFATASENRVLMLSGPAKIRTLPVPEAFSVESFVMNSVRPKSRRAEPEPPYVALTRTTEVRSNAMLRAFPRRELVSR